MPTTLRSLLNNTFHSLLVVILVAVVFYYFWDIPIDQWALNNLQNPSVVNASQHVADIFSSSHIAALGIIIGLVGLYLHFIKRGFATAKPWLMCGGGIVLAFIVAFIIKVVLARYRPDELFAHGLYGFHFFSTADQMNSMPSGHSVMISALCFSLARIIQRWWATALLLILALAVVASRIILIRHYPSDVIVGAYIGIICVIWMQTLLAYKKA